MGGTGQFIRRPWRTRPVGAVGRIIAGVLGLALIVLALTLWLDTPARETTIVSEVSTTHDAGTGASPPATSSVNKQTTTVQPGTPRSEAVVGVVLGVGAALVLVAMFWTRITSIKTPFGEITLGEAVKSAVELTAAEANRQAARTVVDTATIDRLSGSLVQGLADQPPERRPRILWVDDRPDNNKNERSIMERLLNARFVLSPSTQDAVEALKRDGFDLVISDVGRPGEDRAGYALLSTMEGRREPVIFYSSSRRPEHIQEALDAGAVGATNRPDELLELVRRALSR